MIEQAPLKTTAAALRSGQLDLLDYVEQACDRLDALDPQIEAVVPEPERRERLRRQARDLQNRFPDPSQRPPLYGVLLGVKDIFRADGFPTRAGSEVPPEVLAGAEASVVTVLRANGALVLGKTVTAEFAFIEPGPTHNPHNLAHSPGGSSSGSAAAVSAGFCPLALGTQTIGSVIRPAAYCGVLGFKPSYGRIPTDGVIPVSTTLDHVGMFTQDVAGMALAASLVCRDWHTLPAARADDPLPVLGIPTGAYLEQATPEALAVFEGHVARLEQAGYSVRRVPLLDNIQPISEQTRRIMAAEMADAHARYFAQFEAVYRPRTANLIRFGQTVTPDERQQDHAMQAETRAAVAAAMADSHIDLLISPAATSAAPEGLNSTGDSAMNLPWTLIGFPTVALPTDSRSADGLPFGLQCTGASMADERLLRWCENLSDVLLG